MKSKSRKQIPKGYQYKNEIDLSHLMLVWALVFSNESFDGCQFVGQLQSFI